MCHLIPANCNNADILIHLDRCCWSVLTECSWPLQYLGPIRPPSAPWKCFFWLPYSHNFQFNFLAGCLRIFAHLGQFHVWVKWMCLRIYICMCVWGCLNMTWLSKVILQLNTRSWALKFLAALQHVLVLLTKEGVVWAIWQGTRVVAFGNSFEGCSTSIPLPHIWSFKTRQTVLQPRPRPFSIARPFYKLQQEPCSQRPSLKPIAVWSHFAAGRLPQHQLQRMPLASVEAGTSSTCFMVFKKKKIQS